MTAYNLPKEPSGPVWDKEGNKWTRVKRYWWSEEGPIAWATLLGRYGPLSDHPPVKVGDTITVKALADLPEGSIAATSVNAFIVGLSEVWATGDETSSAHAEFPTLNVTVLRIGDGNET